jgi:hypothetical protein
MEDGFIKGLARVNKGFLIGCIAAGACRIALTVNEISVY